MFWIANSIPPNTVTSETETLSDLLSGARPKDRDALRRLTIKRLIMSVSVKNIVASAGVEFSYIVTEMTEAGVAGATVPLVGVAAVGSYLEVDGAVWDSPNTDDAYFKEYDLRTSRALRGSDRTMTFSMQNVSPVNSLSFSMNYRMLIAYG